MSRQRRTSRNDGISQRIKEIREILGAFGRPMPQRALAEAAGVHERTVKRWEDTGEISRPNAMALAQALGCDVEWILEGRGRPPRQGANRARMPQEASSGSGEAGAGPKQAATRLQAIPSGDAGSGDTGLAPQLTPEQVQRLHAAGAALESALEENEMYGDDRHELIEVLEDIQRFLEARGKAVGDLPLVIDTLRKGYL